MDTQDHAGLSTNASGTSREIDPPVTQPCSGFDLTYENDRRAIHRARNRIDSQSRDGHTYSNILELRENWEKSKPGDYCQQHRE